jgi:type IV pilus assembly protein PilO
VADLKKTQHTLKAVLIALGVVDVVAIGLLFSPLVGSVEARLQSLDQLRIEAQQKKRVVEPLNGLDKKIVIASQQIDHFYEHRLPARDSTISENLEALAKDSGVELAQIKSTFGDPTAVALQPVEIEANLSGGYLQLVRFVNSLERDDLFFVVDRVELGGEQGDTVKLHMKLHTYLRTGA